ncbi:site-2 protease family protein [Nocardia inohanensis]|uniref:site-2 protease family protein n=1 Tax=Nocardia inohanensis TaxID=209246 RepID=UPI000836085C|nr:site-2 protease family protein [Nocardia inohanensis]
MRVNGAVAATAAVMAGFSVVLWQTDARLAVAPWILWSYLMISIALHELGHFAAARALGARVEAIYVGGDPDRPGVSAGFRIGGARVFLGWRTGGWTKIPALHAVARPRLIFAAGPAVNLIQVALALAVPLPGLIRFALCVPPAALLAVGLTPARDRRSGFWSDGAHLLGLAPKPQPPTLNHHFGIPALALPAAAGPADRAALAATVLAVCWRSLTAPARDAADRELTAKRLAWLSDNTARTPRLMRVLALAELRADRPEAAEALCGEALTGDSVLAGAMDDGKHDEAFAVGRALAVHDEARPGASPPTAPPSAEFQRPEAIPAEPRSAAVGQRELTAVELADVHAIRALAAHALGVPAQDHLRAAVALDRAGDLVREAVRAIVGSPKPVGQAITGN